MSEYIPLIVALISAITVLCGYIHEKRKEREFQLRETRKEIHQKLIANVIEKNILYEKVMKDPNTPPFNPQIPLEHYNYIENNHEKLWDNLTKGMEIQAWMSMYGSDAAIKATSDFWRTSVAFSQQQSIEPASLALIILQLRKSLFADTAVSEEDIQFMLTR